MTNIVTRKGLAFGALVALASTAIAGAPAQAAGEVVFAPNAGTSYNAFVTDSFTLNASLAAGQVASNIAQLKYSIALPAALASGNTVAYKVNAGSWTNSTASATTPEVISGSGSAVAANTLEIAIDTASGTANVQAPAATADTKSVTVTAFIDSNNNSVADAGEFSQARTVTFKKYSEVTPTVTLTQPTVGASSASATVVVADMNYTASLLKATFTGVTGATAAPGVAVNSTTGVATDGTAVTSTAVTAQAYYNGVALGTAVSATPTARTISAITASIAASDNSKASSAGAADVRIDGAWAAKVYAADLTTPTALAASGIAAKATVAVTGATLAAATSSASEVSITVAGVKYTSATDLAAASFPVTTGTDGYASLAISTSGFANGNTVAVTFSAQNYSSTVTATAKTLAYTVTEANTALTRATQKNTAVAVAYTVKDQFGVKSAATNQRLVISASNSTTTSSAAQYVAVAAGVAGATITPITDSTAAMVVHAVLQDSTYSSSTGATTWAGATGATDAADITVNITSVAYDFTTAPALVGVAGAAYSSSAPTKQVVTLAAVADLAASANANGNATWASISLTGNVAGGVVTISAPGAFISTAAGVAGVADSATLYATGSSQTVYIASNTVGTKTVSFTTGAVTKTVDVVFTSGAASTAASLAVAVTAAAQSGRAIDATVTVTDKFGNPIAGFVATATVSGVALVNGKAADDVTTDANGKATVKLSAGVNDLGDAVVTFADKGTNSVSTTAPVTAVAKTVTFGMTDGYIDVLNGKRASVTWSFAKGKRAAFYLDGVRKYNLVQPGDAEMNLQFNLKKGTHTIKLVIGGVTVDSITVKISK